MNENEQLLGGDLPNKSENFKRKANKGRLEDKTWWIVVNSKFALFIMGGIILSFIVNRYSLWEAQNKAKIELIKEKNKILSEIQYRFISIDKCIGKIEKVNELGKINPLIKKIENSFLGDSSSLLHSDFKGASFADLFSGYTIIDKKVLAGYDASIIDMLLEVIDFSFNEIYVEEDIEQIKIEIKCMLMRYRLFRKKINDIEKHRI